MKNVLGIIFKQTLVIPFWVFKKMMFREIRYPNQGHASTKSVGTRTKIPHPDVSDSKVWVPCYHVTNIVLHSINLIQMTLLT